MSMLSYCVFCEEITSFNYCPTCNEYKGLTRLDDYIKELQLDNYFLHERIKKIHNLSEVNY